MRGILAIDHRRKTLFSQPVNFAKVGQTEVVSVSEPQVTNWEDADTGYNCRAILRQDLDGGYSAYVARLPAVAARGETEEEAIANVSAALVAALKEYRNSGREIPWERFRDCGCKTVLLSVRLVDET